VAVQLDIAYSVTDHTWRALDTFTFEVLKLEKRQKGAIPASSHACMVARCERCCCNTCARAGHWQTPTELLRWVTNMIGPGIAKFIVLAGL
jgi:hypothetical protein